MFPPQEIHSLLPQSPSVQIYSNWVKYSSQIPSGKSLGFEGQRRWSRFPLAVWPRGTSAPLEAPFLSPSHGDNKAYVMGSSWKASFSREQPLYVARPTLRTHLLCSDKDAGDSHGEFILKLMQRFSSAFVRAPLPPQSRPPRFGNLRFACHDFYFEAETQLPQQPAWVLNQMKKIK